MTNPNYYNSHNYCDSLVMDMLYPLYNLNCKHRTGTFANYNKCYSALLIVPCHEEQKKYYDNKLNSTTNML